MARLFGAQVRVLCMQPVESVCQAKRQAEELQKRHGMLVQKEQVVLQMVPGPEKQELLEQIEIEKQAVRPPRMKCRSLESQLSSGACLPQYRVATSKGEEEFVWVVQEIHPKQITRNPYHRHVQPVGAAFRWYSVVHIMMGCGVRPRQLKWTQMIRTSCND